MEIKSMVEEVLNDDPIKDIVNKKETRLNVISDDQDINTDYTYARENYYNLMEKGHEALDELLEIAKSTEHARHFEVASQLIKNLGDTNEKLMNLQKTKKEVLRDKNAQGPTSVNNNLYVGSTADLLKMLKNKENGNE
ncbi:MAG: terminase [Flavobacteriaceae bacterium]|nr:terminase [Flavobacteriaceae bacterium]|tara:strand:- start:42 stop:455 length:414 start_codon:yes stop_codon:yes gene_type:complete